MNREQAREREQIAAEGTPADDEISVTDRKAAVLRLFDVASVVHCTVAVFEDRIPEAPELLRLWAIEHREVATIMRQHATSVCRAYDVYRIQFAGGHEIVVYGKDLR
jgi:hypothetical protein